MRQDGNSQVIKPPVQHRGGNCEAGGNIWGCGPSLPWHYQPKAALERWGSKGSRERGLSRSSMRK